MMEHRPYTMVCIPRVAMKGGTFRKATTQPFTAPNSAMIAMTMSMATPQGMSGSQGSIRAE